MEKQKIFLDLDDKTFIIATWENITVPFCKHTLRCGQAATIAVTKKIGVVETSRKELESTLKANAKFFGIANLEAELGGKISQEVSITSESTTVIEMPISVKGGAKVYHRGGVKVYH